MNNLMQQLQSMLGQTTKKNGDGASGLSNMLVPGALGGLAGLLVGSKSSRKLLSKYGSSALLAGGGAVLGTVLWNKYKDRIRQNHQDEPQYGQQVAPIDQRVQRLVMALVFAAKSDGHIDAKERSIIEQNSAKRVSVSRVNVWCNRQLTSHWILNYWRVIFKMKRKRWSYTS